MINFNKNTVDFCDNNEMDLNKNLVNYDRKPSDIKILCDKCEIPKEAKLNIFKDYLEVRQIEFIDDLKQRKFIWKVPWFMLSIGFLQITLFWITNTCMRQQLMFMPETTNEYWRYFTYMLLHSDVLHLSMNVCLQFVIGFWLESEQGHLRVSCIYVIGGIAGSLATLYLQPQLSLMGASAGVYAMLMSHIPHLLKNFQNLPHRYLRILVVMILFASDICFTTYHVLINHNTNPRICLEAHAAGAISGLVFGFLVYSSTTSNKTNNNNNNVLTKHLFEEKNSIPHA